MSRLDTFHQKGLILHIKDGKNEAEVGKKDGQNSDISKTLHLPLAKEITCPHASRIILLTWN
jgi:hypothetical protein